MEAYKVIQVISLLGFYLLVREMGNDPIGRGFESPAPAISSLRGRYLNYHDSYGTEC